MRCSRALPSAPKKKPFARGRRTVLRGGAWSLYRQDQVLPAFCSAGEQLQELQRSPDRYCFEPLWDGHRVLIARLGDSVRVASEDGRDWSAHLPRIRRAVLDLGHDPFLAEGVLTALDEQGKPSFERLRALLDDSTEHGVLVVLTDLLLASGSELRNKLFEQRSAALRECALPAQGPLVRSQAIEGPMSQMLAAVRALGFRGLLARPRASHYPPAEADAWIAVYEEQPSTPRRYLSPKPKVTNASKVLYPRDGISKAEIVAYYADVAPLLLRYLKRRPVVAQRWPDGIDDFTWYQHRVPPRAPDYITPILIDDVRRILIENEDALLWFANQAALTFHGFASRAESLDCPDWMIVDLDPGEATRWGDTIEVALALRKALELLGVESVVKTSGKKGLHVLVPLAPGQRGALVQEAARRIAQVLHRLLPATTTLETEKEKRLGRLLIDTTQGFRGKILVMPYALRDADRAPVSTPLSWSEVRESLDPRAFNLRTLRLRLDRVGDLAEPLLAGRADAQRLLEKLG